MLDAVCMQLQLFGQHAEVCENPVYHYYEDYQKQRHRDGPLPRSNIHITAVFVLPGFFQGPNRRNRFALEKLDVKGEGN